MKQALLDRLVADRAAKRPAALVTDLADGSQAIVREGDVEGELALDEAALADVRLALRRDDSDILEAAGRRYFIQVHNPPPRLFLVGAVHIAQALAPMAALTGYGVSVIDPRRSFATDARFPGLALSHDWPDEAMAALGLDSRTAVVTLTHDPKLDDPALASALRSPAFYIGALGSKRTHAGRLARLAKDGFSPADLARIHGPVGLAIGALSPAEIAVSILAQITAVRRAA
ncbi:MAG TPA: XdhC family protein [Candidatus Udaeobacter sp.]|nr:XdhC family protein [Candidatus Udaeobacter sp.]